MHLNGVVSSVRGRGVELRARQIADPIVRLRYCRRAMGVARTPKLSQRISRFQLRALGLGLALLCLPLRPTEETRLHAWPPELRVPFGGPATAVPRVWLVENRGGVEIYSNGLRVETAGTVAGEPRWYVALSRRPVTDPFEERSAPAGIVFHMSESHLLPLEEERNAELRRLRAGLLAYVRQRRSYHYLVDRFGTVHRVVEDRAKAEHAGHSVWADSRWIYLNLNESFLGVAFEAITLPGETRPTLTPAQVHCARTLTEMLRSRYEIPAENCVTHAQVSVNPGNFRIGYHTDGAGNFPFAALGLPDNYNLPLPSLWLFGFRYDNLFLESTGGRMSQGLVWAEEQLRQDAAAQGMSLKQYRKALQQKYRELARALPGSEISKEKSE